MTAMKSAIERESQPFILFGGEPLLVPENDLDSLWAWGLEKFGSNGLQTNGVLINENHIRMFKQYNVQVGISIDGPAELNDVRWSGSLVRTREATRRTEKAIERLCKEGIHPSLIVTLHRNNSTRDKLSVMDEWFLYLERLGVTSIRLHILETDNEAILAKYGLTDEENIAAFLHFAELERRLTTMRFDVFEDVKNLMLGRDEDVSCTWVGCDPYTTNAVCGIEGNGESSSCGRVNKDGIDSTKADVPGYERYIALFHTPQEHGGCKDCRFFLICKGQCPGSGVAGDWRNRSAQCGVWKAIYRQVEDHLLDQGIMPLSAAPIRRQVERALLQEWSSGSNPLIRDIMQNLTPDDMPVVRETANAGDDKAIILPPRPHTDVPPPHTDHQDHAHRDLAHRDQPLEHRDAVTHKDTGHRPPPHMDRPPPPPHRDRRG